MQEVGASHLTRALREEAALCREEGNEARARKLEAQADRGDWLSNAISGSTQRS